MVIKSNEGGVDLVGSAGYVWLVLLVTLVMFGCLGVESIS